MNYLHKYGQNVQIRVHKNPFSLDLRTVQIFAKWLCNISINVHRINNIVFRKKSLIKICVEIAWTLWQSRLNTHDRLICIYIFKGNNICLINGFTNQNVLHQQHRVQYKPTYLLTLSVYAKRRHSLGCKHCDRIVCLPVK